MPPNNMEPSMHERRPKPELSLRPVNGADKADAIKSPKARAKVKGSPKGRKDAKGKFTEDDEEYKIPLFTQIMTYLNYAMLAFWGYVRDFFRLFSPDPLFAIPKGYAPIVNPMDHFFARRFYYRAHDCTNVPVSTRAGRLIGVMERVSYNQNKTFHLTGKVIPAYNMASYNYLGFSEDLPAITDDNLDSLQKYGLGACASAMEGGRSDILRQLEEETAEHVGKEAAVVYAMGFATNFSGLVGMVDTQSLYISDSLNHASLVAGQRLSPACIRIFRHNNLEELERIVRQAITDGQPRTRRPWKRIVILLEGVYSLEGEILDLPVVVRIKKQYNCLLYVDEAHSIGALGATGRGVCEHWGVDPADVDVLMGTYTKSFGSIGGYIAADRAFIDFMKKWSGGRLVGDTLHSAAAQQALSSLRVIRGKDGTTVGKDKIAKLADNSRFFREGLIKLGLQVYGDDASPVIPVMLYGAAKIPAFSRECLKRNLAVVVVGYPATSLIESRVRFCVSAAHTREDLERILEIVDEVASVVCIRYERRCHVM